MKGYDIRGDHDSPVLVSVPHNGTEIPPEISAQLAVSPAQAGARVDMHAAELAAGALPYALVIQALYARVVIDLNRSGTLSELDLAHAPEQDGERLVRLYGSRGEPLWRARLGAPPLTRAELQRRVRRYHEPYHQALRQLLAQAPRPCVLVDMHSMDEVAFDIVIGDFRGRSAGVELCEQLVRPFFAERGYRVGYAGPRAVDRRGRAISAVAVRHSGGFITSCYGAPEQGCHALQIETSRRTATQRLGPMQADFADFFRYLREEMAARHQPRARCAGSSSGANGISV